MGTVVLELTEAVVVAVDETSVVGLSIITLLCNNTEPFRDLEGAGDVGAESKVAGGGDVDERKPPTIPLTVDGGGGDWASTVDGGLRFILLSRLLCCCDEAGDNGISSIFSRSWAIELEFCL